MATWINHVAIAGPRNGTTSHTIDPASGTVVAGTLFTPTAGRLLLVVAEGSVTSTTPSGWTLPSGGSAVNNTGLYVWYRTAAGSDTFSSTHNGSNYPVIFDIYEFSSGSTFSGSVAATGVSRNGGAGPTLTGLTGTNFVMAAAAQGLSSTSGSYAYSWDNGVEATDTFTLRAGTPATDGYTYSLTYREDYASATSSSAATSTYTASTVERLVFAVKISNGTLDKAKVGASLINALKVGSSTVDKLYAGSTQIWP